MSAGVPRLSWLTLSWLTLGAAIASSGCVVSSSGADVSRVRELTRVPSLPEVAEIANVDLELAASENAGKLLAKPLDADAAVRIAILQNRELRAVLRDVGVARGRVLQAGLLPNPLVEAEFVPERDSLLALRVEYDLKGAVLAPLRAQAFAPELEVARYRAAQGVIELGYQVRAAVYRVQSTTQRLQIAQRVLDGFAAARDATEAMHAAGNVANLERASREAAYQKARVVVAELELEAANEREDLHQRLGVFGAQTNWTLASGLPEAPKTLALPDALEAAVLRANLAMHETRHELEGLARKAGVARIDGLLPDLSVDAHALLTDTQDGTAGGNPRGWRFGAGVTMGLPVFNRNQGTSLSLEAQFDAGLERYLGAAVELRSEARKARARVVSAHARARQYQEVIVPAQRVVTDETLLQYNAMQVGIYQVLAARREALEVDLAEVEMRREYWTARALLDALLAGARPGSGAAPRVRMPASGEQSAGGH